MTFKALLKIKQSLLMLLSILVSFPLIKSMYNLVVALSLAITWMAQ
jgi:hypothetical protein